jgi:hypothetical protein
MNVSKDTVGKKIDIIVANGQSITGTVTDVTEDSIVMEIEVEKKSAAGNYKFMRIVNINKDSHYLLGIAYDKES